MAAVVLLPGMDGTGSLFSEFIAALPRGLKPVVVTYPLDRSMSYAELEQFARARLPAERPFVLVGESFSGPIAISLAASKPAGLRGGPCLLVRPQRNPCAERSLFCDQPVPGKIGTQSDNCRITAWALRVASAS